MIKTLRTKRLLILKADINRQVVGCGTPTSNFSSRFHSLPGPKVSDKVAFETQMRNWYFRKEHNLQLGSPRVLPPARPPFIAATSRFTAWSSQNILDFESEESSDTVAETCDIDDKNPMFLLVTAIDSEDRLESVSVQVSDTAEEVTTDISQTVEEGDVDETVFDADLISFSEGIVDSDSAIDEGSATLVMPRQDRSKSPSIATRSRSTSTPVSVNNERLPSAFRFPRQAHIKEKVVVKTEVKPAKRRTKKASVTPVEGPRRSPRIRSQVVMQ